MWEGRGVSTFLDGESTMATTKMASEMVKEFKLTQTVPSTLETGKMASELMSWSKNLAISNQNLSINH